MTYPYRYPLSNFFAKLGVTLTIRIDVIKDEEVGIYIATSKDVPGLVIEAETFSELHDGVSEAVPVLLSSENKARKQRTVADVLYRDHIALA